jgi:negative regulator of flagellin synthesis FlgM
MDIRSSMEGLRSLLGVSTAQTSSSQQTRQAPASDGGSFSTDHATLSSAGSLASQALSDDGVRMDKVDSIRAALAAGTYEVPSSAVAFKMVDSMLGLGS